MKSVLAEQRRKFLQQKADEEKAVQKEKERQEKIKRFRGPSILIIAEASDEGSDDESANFNGEEDQEELFADGEFELRVMDNGASPSPNNQKRNSLKAKKKKDAMLLQEAAERSRTCVELDKYTSSSNSSKIAFDSLGTLTKGSNLSSGSKNSANPNTFQPSFAKKVQVSNHSSEKVADNLPSFGGESSNKQSTAPGPTSTLKLTADKEEEEEDLLKVPLAYHAVNSQRSSRQSI